MTGRNDSLYRRIESVVGVLVCAVMLVPCALTDLGNIWINIGLCIFLVGIALGYTGVYRWMKNKFFPRSKKRTGMSSILNFGRREDNDA